MTELRIKLDATDLERRLERVRRDEERDSALRSKSTRLILANPFIEALTKNGLVPAGTTYIRITGELNSVLRLDYETIATSELVEVAESMREAESREEAKVT